MSFRPPKFRNWSPPKKAEGVRLPFERASPRERGYDARWDRVSVAYRRTHPFCEECERRGEFGLAEVVDHIVPVVDRPDLKYEPTNLQSLCGAHHNGWKASLENWARKSQKQGSLAEMVRDMSKRPEQFRR